MEGSKFCWLGSTYWDSWKSASRSHLKNNAFPICRPREFSTSLHTYVKFWNHFLNRRWVIKLRRWEKNSKGSPTSLVHLHRAPEICLDLSPIGRDKNLINTSLSWVSKPFMHKWGDVLIQSSLLQQGACINHPNSHFHNHSNTRPKLFFSSFF